jgi:hypothetical protein
MASKNINSLLNGNNPNNGKKSIFLRLFNLFKSEKFILRLCLFTTLFLCMNLIINDKKIKHGRIKRHLIRNSNSFFINSKSNLHNHSSNSISETFNTTKKIELDAWNDLRASFDNIKFKLESNNLNNNMTKQLCSEVPREIGKRIFVKKIPDDFTATDNTNEYPFTKNLIMGGHYKPVDCVARHKVAIIIPYKNRASNLNDFMYHMHPFLQKQELDYQIFVVEQFNNNLFNKGVLMNSAFLQILNMYNMSNMIDFVNNYKNTNSTSGFKYPFDCVVFHDVDLLVILKRI